MSVVTEWLLANFWPLTFVCVGLYIGSKALEKHFAKKSEQSVEAQTSSEVSPEECIEVSEGSENV